MMMNDELYHYGVLGMKWGRRKARNKSSKTNRVRMKRGINKGKTIAKNVMNKCGETYYRDASRKKLAKMSNDELRTLINQRQERATLEKQYLELYPQKPSGQKIVNNIVKNTVAPVVMDLGKQLVKSYFTKMINETLGLPEEYKVYTNNKKKK